MTNAQWQGFIQSIRQLNKMSENKEQLDQALENIMEASKKVTAERSKNEQ